MTAREEAARRFAEVMGWECELGHWTRGAGELVVTAFYVRVSSEGDVEPEDEIEFPAPDAPLHEHLAFVGRIAEACEVREFAIESPTYRNGDESFRVTFWPGISACVGDATDLSHAALLAATAARAKGEGRK